MAVSPSQRRTASSSGSSRGMVGRGPQEGPPAGFLGHVLLAAVLGAGDQALAVGLAVVGVGVEAPAAVQAPLPLRASGPA
ncbi:hypothetical protein [Nonomuraea sp. NPDC052265]|uniref:hypothetical protein n=1 Tax=Nonomuraea sp. NPDC052265 TaxID=3364374 RepID=UPI0037C53764